MILTGPRNDGVCTLKVCVRGQKPDRETAVSEHIRKANDHSGKRRIRTVLDAFEIPGLHGVHNCLIYQALGMTYTGFQRLLPDKKSSTHFDIIGLRTRERCRAYW